MDAIARLCLSVDKPEAGIFGFKNPHGIFHPDFIWSLYPEARILNVIRDPRGVLASEKNRFPKGQTYRPASLIRTVTLRFKRMIRAHEQIEHDPRYLAVRYTDLVEHFDDTVKAVLDFVGVGYAEQVQDFDTYARQKKLTPKSEMHLHSLAVRKPDPSRLKAYRAELDGYELAAIEAALGPDLRRITKEGFDTPRTKRIAARGRYLAQLFTEKVLLGERNKPI
jgi:hypothetical protein